MATKVSWITRCAVGALTGFAIYLFQEVHHRTELAEFINTSPDAKRSGLVSAEAPDLFSRTLRVTHPLCSNEFLVGMLHAGDVPLGTNLVKAGFARVECTSGDGLAVSRDL